MAMAHMPTGLATIRSAKYNELMYTSGDMLDNQRRHVSTWVGNECPPGPVEASQWNIVKCGDNVVRIQNVSTKEWAYANCPMYDKDRRRCLTFDRNGAGPQLSDLAYKWHLVPYGSTFGIKNAKYDEWLYAKGPKLNDQCRHVLAWVPGGNDPKVDESARWLIQEVGTNMNVACLPAGVQHDTQNSGTLVRIESSGYSDGNVASFYLDEAPIGFNTSRGLNIIVLDPSSLQVLSKRAYDIYDSYGERNQLACDLNALPAGHIVLAALKDSGMEQLGIADKIALGNLGATFSKGRFREGYALIGTKGGCAVAEAQGNAVTVMATLSCPASKSWKNSVLASTSRTVTIKLKYKGVFHRVHVKVPLEFPAFEKSLRGALGLAFSGFRAMYLDEEGDECIINEATFSDLLQGLTSKKLGENDILKVEVKDVEKEMDSTSSCNGSFDFVEVAKEAAAAGNTTDPSVAEQQEMQEVG